MIRGYSSSLIMMGIIVLVMVISIITGCIDYQSSESTRGVIEEEVAVEIERLSSPKAEVRARAAASLANIGDRATPAIPALIGILDDDTQVYRSVSPVFPVGVSTSPGAEAAKALIKIGEPAIEPLIFALGDSNSNVRLAAAKILQDMTGQDFGENRAKWQEWWQQNR
ncbi:HEAT repeat domain-containing protein [Chloroflexota bacterium]